MPCELSSTITLSGSSLVGCLSSTTFPRAIRWTREKDIRSGRVSRNEVERNTDSCFCSGGKIRCWQCLPTKIYSSVPCVHGLVTFMHSNVWGFSAELIESAMYLYRATRDPTLLELGRDAVESIEKISKVDCGFATVSAKSMVTSAKWLLKVRF